MRRTRWALVGCALSIALIAPTGAHADLLGAYQRLAKQRLRPAPLVPTTVPASVGPIDRTIEMSGSRRKGGYLIRLVHRDRGGLPDAIIALEAGAFRTMKASLAEFRRLGFSRRATRVRGHAAYLLRRPREFWLSWVEDGRVYSIGTGTTRKVSLAQLRAAAAGLDRLERDYVGSSYDTNTNAEYGAVLVTTQHTVTGEIEWGPPCFAADGSPSTPYAGHADLVLLPRSGNTFSFDIAKLNVGSYAWSGSVSGTVSASAIALSIHATGSFSGSSCDSGDVALPLDKRSL
jgi:hypothetical protein